MKGCREISLKNGAVVILASLINCLIMGTMRLSNLFFVAILDHLNVSREDAAFPFFLATSVRVATGPFIGYLGKKCGPRLVTFYGCLFAFLGIAMCHFAENMLIINIFYGGIFGLGAGLGTILLPQILSQHFKKHLDKAVGICYGSECLSGFMAPAFFTYLLTKFQLSGTFLIISALVLHAVPSSIALRLLSASGKQQNGQIHNSQPIEEPKEVKEIETNSKTIEKQNTVERELHQEHKVKNTSGSSKFKDITIVKQLGIFLDPVFLIIMFTSSMSIFIVISTNTVLVDFSRDAHVLPHQEIYPVMGYAVADLIGRFSSGFITDGGCLTRIKFIAISYFIIGLIQFFFSFLKGLTSVLLVVIIYAFMFGGNFTVSPGIVVEFIEANNLSMAFSCRFLLCAPLGLAISPLIGYFREEKGSYDGLFYIGGVIAVSCSILTLLIPVLAKRKLKIQNSETC